jgi:GT2 family glycosyltransferase
MARTPSLPLPDAPTGKRGWPWEPVAAPRPAVADPPRITLVTPSFNQVRFVEATLRSVLLQDYPNLQYLVLDGGSTDGSAGVIRRYAPHLDHFASRLDRGQSDALNQGFALADGEVLGWINSDDRLLPGALWSVAAAVRAAPDAAAWVGEVRSVDATGRLVYVQRPRGLSLPELADWGHAGHFAQPGCFFSAAKARAAGALDETLHYAFDVDLWLRLAAQGPFVACGGVPWAEESLHADAKTQAQRGKSLAELHLVQIRRGFEEVALARMGAALQEWSRHRSSTLGTRLRERLNLAVRPLLERLRRP